MRRIVIAMAALLILAGSTAPRTAWAQAPNKKQPPETSVKNNRLGFSLPDLAGKAVSLSDPRFRGKVVLVDIWGTWCPPCRKEIPFLVKLYDKYHAKGLEIIGIAFEKGPEKEQLAGVKDFVKKNGINYTVLFGGSTGETEKAITGLQDFRGYPTGIFIGADGKVAKVEVGFSDSMADEMEAKIAEMLGAKS